MEHDLLRECEDAVRRGTVVTAQARFERHPEAMEPRVFVTGSFDCPSGGIRELLRTGDAVWWPSLPPKNCGFDYWLVEHSGSVTMMKSAGPSERTHIEEEIEKIMRRHFGVYWSFETAREKPDTLQSVALIALRDLVEKSAERGQTKERLDEIEAILQSCVTQNVTNTPVANSNDNDNDNDNDSDNENEDGDEE